MATALESSVAQWEDPSAMEEGVDTLIECPDCGLLQDLPAVPFGALAACPRCDALLHQSQRHTVPLSLACSGVGLLLFVLAFSMPVATASMPGGRTVTSDLFTGPALLRQTGAGELSVVVVLTLMVLPAFELLTIVAMAYSVRMGTVPRWVRRCFAALPALSSWAMIEVFMLGATISLVRLRAWMQVEFGPALFALGGVALCSIGVGAALDRRALWSRVPRRRRAARRSASSTFISCAGCDLVTRCDDGAACRRCNRTMHARKPHSVPRTWALVLTAALLAIPANVLPVMTIVKSGKGGPSTIMGGTVELIEHGYWILALIVFVASIIVPVFKLVALCTLLICTACAASGRLRLRAKLFRVVTFIGRWSMLDIFATMTLVELARFGWLGSVRPGTGATAFCAVVVLTMLASESFDPRLMWDAAGENHEPIVPARESWRAA
jgi:paraquat-inducible protein A